MEETHHCRQPEVIKTPARRVLVLSQSRPAAEIFNTPSSSTAYRNIRRVEGDSEAAEGRERLKRHREEVAGKVAVPEDWGQEKLLKDWMDYAPFDKLLAPAGLASARAALAAEGRRVGGGGQRLRIESRCC